jgi:hypothetical protein
MRLRSAILLSLSVGWLLLTGCSETSPYLREVRPAYDCVETAGGMETGLQCKPLPDHYAIPKPYLRHLLADLKACYGEAR